MTSVSFGPSWASVCPATAWSGRAVATSFVARPRHVAAIAHDGTPASAARLTQWVLQASAEIRATAGVRVSGDALVVDQPQGQVFVRAGTVLVLDRAEEVCWSVVSLAQFTRTFAATARELPIFDDGEVA